MQIYRLWLLDICRRWQTDKDKLFTHFLVSFQYSRDLLMNLGKGNITYHISHLYSRLSCQILTKCCLSSCKGPLQTVGRHLSEKHFAGTACTRCVCVFICHTTRLLSNKESNHWKKIKFSQQNIENIFFYLVMLTIV